MCNGATILTNDHLVERGVFIANPAGFLQPRPPYLINGAPVRELRAAPELGQHTDSVVWPPPIGPADDTAAPSGLPLAGLKVLDLTSWWAGPSSTNSWPPWAPR